MENETPTRSSYIILFCGYIYLSWFASVLEMEKMEMHHNNIRLEM